MNSTILIWVVTILYLIQAGYNLYIGQPHSSIMLLGWSLANIGVIWSLQ